MKLFREIGICLFSILLLASCVGEDAKREYVFLSHIYQNETQVDNRIVSIDLSCYDQIWLGGDICANTTQDSETMEYIDDLFDLRSPTTHWALGNHDSAHGNLDRITGRTYRPTHYAAHFDGITFLVLNTNLPLGHSLDSLDLNDQFEMIVEVCDSIVQSSHLVLMSHHCLWAEIDGCQDAGTAANTDGSGYPLRFEPSMTYAKGIYPKLIEVENKGVEVIHLAGDFGQNHGRYQRITDDGVQFIGSGITANTMYNETFPSAGQSDSILVFHHNVATRSLTWSSQVLSNLIDD